MSRKVLDYRASQPDRLGLDLGSYAFLEHVGRRDIDRRGEDLLGMAPEGGEVQQRPARRELDQEIDVI